MVEDLEDEDPVLREGVVFENDVLGPVEVDAAGEEAEVFLEDVVEEGDSARVEGDGGGGDREGE